MILNGIHLVPEGTKSFQVCNNTVSQNHISTKDIIFILLLLHMHFSSPLFGDEMGLEKAFNNSWPCKVSVGVRIKRNSSNGFVWWPAPKKNYVKSALASFGRITMKWFFTTTSWNRFWALQKILIVKFSTIHASVAVMKSCGYSIH